MKSFIWRFIRPYKWAYLIVGLVSIGWAIDVTVWPYLIKIFIDIFTRYDTAREGIWEALKLPLICGLSLWVLIDGAFRVQGFLLAKLLPRLEADIRMNMFDHVQHHSPKYFNDNYAGSLANKITDMTTQISLIIQQVLTIFIPALVGCCLSIGFFYWLNPYFALLLSLWLLIHFTICGFFVKKCAQFEHEHGEVRSELIGKIVDSLTNNFAVNLFFRFKHEKRVIALLQEKEERKNLQAKRYVEYMRIALGLSVLCIGVVPINILMFHFWKEGKLSTGELAQVFNTVWNILMMMWVAGTALPGLFQSFGIAKQAFTVMEDPKDIEDHVDAKPLVVTKGAITFENVSFSYGEKKLFENKNLHIKGGEKVGLVGYSGAGKSTFVNLILRFFPVHDGKILIDDHEISKVTLESLRQNVTLVPQDPQLFHRSLEDNIHYGNVTIDKKEVKRAAAFAKLDAMISNLPEGYETEVGERGAKLSGGERQRIAIARSLLTSAPILILDEATSALDSVTEHYIQEALEKLMENRTTIVIAHRLSTLSKMDRILVFDKGKIIEEGNHNELLQKNGHYAKMWKKQAGGFLPSEMLSG